MNLIFFIYCYFIEELVQSIGIKKSYFISSYIKLYIIQYSYKYYYYYYYLWYNELLLLGEAKKKKKKRRQINYAGAS